MKVPLKLLYVLGLRLVIDRFFHFNISKECSKSSNSNCSHVIKSDVLWSLGSGGPKRGYLTAKREIDKTYDAECQTLNYG